MLTRLELYESGAMLLATGTFFMWRDALRPPPGRLELYERGAMLLELYVAGAIHLPPHHHHHQSQTKQRMRTLRDSCFFRAISKTGLV